RIKQTGLSTWIGLRHAARTHRGNQALNRSGKWWRVRHTQLNYSPILLALCTVIMVSMFWIAPFACLLQPMQENYIVGAMVWIAMFFTYLPTLIYYRRSPLWGFALPVIGTLYLAMTWTSALRYWWGERACWKDRRYESKTNS
ncbi:MAG: glycosyl transferase, partial [Pseudomonadota bacterium]